MTGVRPAPAAATGLVVLAVVLASACAGFERIAPDHGPLQAADHAHDSPLLEVRLAHTHPAPGLERREHDGEALFLEPAAILSDEDFVRVRPLRDSAVPDAIVLVVQCSVAASDRMQRATSAHIGAPAAILWQDSVRLASIVRDFVGCDPAAMGFEVRDEDEREEIEALVRERWPQEAPHATTDPDAAPLLDLRLTYSGAFSGIEPTEHDGDTLFVIPVSMVDDSELVHVRPILHPERPERITLHARCTLVADRHMREATRSAAGETLVVFVDSRIRSAVPIDGEVGCASGIRLEIDLQDEGERNRLFEAVRARWPADPADDLV